MEDREIHERLRPCVVEFCRARVGQVFLADELRRYIARFLHAAPESPTRALRAMRARGIVQYEVVDRKASLFRVLGVAP